MITPADEYFHDRSDDPARPNMGCSSGGFAASAPSGDRVDDCLWYDLEQISPPPGAEMFDFSLPAGLTVTCRAAQHEYRLEYKADGCEADFTWRRVREPYAPPLAPTQEPWGRRHYDQIGRMTGRVTVDGETIDVDGWSMRDHSWGPRRIAADQRGRFVWGIASEDDAEGRAVNMMIWPCYPTIHSRFARFEWHVGGRAASGEEQEWIPMARRRRFVRSHLHG